MFQYIGSKFCVINTIWDHLKWHFNRWAINRLTYREKMEAGEKLKWMVSWWKEIEGGLRDKSSSVERWQGWSWMQPLLAWWLIATKMSTFHPCSQCNHSTRCCFLNPACHPDRLGRTRCTSCVCACMPYATVLLLQALKINLVWALLWFAVERFSVPSCLSLVSFIY